MFGANIWKKAPPVPAADDKFTFITYCKSWIFTTYSSLERKKGSNKTNGQNSTLLLSLIVLLMDFFYYQHFQIHSITELASWQSGFVKITNLVHPNIVSHAMIEVNNCQLLIVFIAYNYLVVHHDWYSCLDSNRWVSYLWAKGSKCSICFWASFIIKTSFQITDRSQALYWLILAGAILVNHNYLITIFSAQKPNSVIFVWCP